MSNNSESKYNYLDAFYDYQEKIIPATEETNTKKLLKQITSYAESLENKQKQDDSFEQGAHSGLNAAMSGPDHWKELKKTFWQDDDIDALGGRPLGDEQERSAAVKPGSYSMGALVGSPWANSKKPWSKKIVSLGAELDPLPPAVPIYTADYQYPLEAKAAPKPKKPRYPAYKKDDRVNTPEGPGNVWSVDRDGTVCVELDKDPSILHEFEKKELKKIKK